MLLPPLDPPHKEMVTKWSRGGTLKIVMFKDCVTTATHDLGVWFGEAWRTRAPKNNTPWFSPGREVLSRPPEPMATPVVGEPASQNRSCWTGLLSAIHTAKYNPFQTFMYSSLPIRIWKTERSDVSTKGLSSSGCFTSHRFSLLKPRSRTTLGRALFGLNSLAMRPRQLRNKLVCVR